jgi:hypothetical protein
MRPLYDFQVFLPPNHDPSLAKQFNNEQGYSTVYSEKGASSVDNSSCMLVFAVTLSKGALLHCSWCARARVVSVPGQRAEQSRKVALS